MRGTRDKLFDRLDVRGIIPAYAGNTPHRCWNRPWTWDHPRVCGEHRPAWVTLTCVGGSSPRMRGTPIHRTCILPRHGIIPAYAGNTPRCRLRESRWRDHPRVCGEHYAPNKRRTFAAGSSPRMRGTPVSHYPHPRGYGIIPAYAGNTLFRRFPSVSNGDHPRVCGEHTKRL